MMVGKPVVSVIIPAYNSARWLPETLHSVVAQTWGDLEIVVVDDGSSDDTLSRAATIEDRRIKLVQQTHSGAAAARNRGLRETTGELIQFLDADDLLSPGKITAQVNALRTAPPGSVASCAWCHFAEVPGDMQKESEPVWSEPDPFTWLVRSYTGEGMMQPGGWLVPRTITDLAGAWDETLSLHDDADYFLRVLINSARNVFVKGPTVHYRSSAESLSRIRGRSAAESSLQVCRSRQRILQAVSNDEAVRVALATRYAQFAYEFGTSAPDLAESALIAIAELNAEPANTVGGPVFRRFVPLLGFARAVRLRSLGTRRRSQWNSWK